MIQSDNSESKSMNIKNFIDKSAIFLIRRIFECFGILLVVISVLFFISLISYSPEDTNLIFDNGSDIENLMGSYGSFVSDIFFQSFGIISFLIPVTLLLTGIGVIINKKIIFILENIFFTVLYLISGSLFFTIFYKKSFSLSINGNGGFVGNFFINNSFIAKIVTENNIAFYLLIFITLGLFCLSAKLSLKKIFNFIKFIASIFQSKDKIEKYKANLNEKDFNVQNESAVEQNRTQKDLPFNRNYDSKKVFFKVPKIDILDVPIKNNKKKIQENIDDKFLEKILLDFGVQGKIKKVNHGPVVTLNEFEPAAGVKVSKIVNLSEDIARNTSSESARISTIPGSNTVGIEIPNSSRENVYLREIISNSNFKNKDIKLPIALGKSISGVPIIGDLSSMPHLLIAGTTGSGKSVCINTIILSLIYRHSPEKCKFILIDPKMLELSTYEGIPHLLCPVITEAKKAASVLGWVVKEMESRYRLMTKEGVRNIDGYNLKHSKLPMPYIVVIVDEMSDLMLISGKEIESYIQKLSQMARASGIHIIMATQRPSVDVITGTIKANFPTRISFQVSSKIDSRTILGEQGAEQLLGKGDMLYMSSANRIVRIHAPFVSDEEIEKVNNFIRSQAEPDYIDEILNFEERESSQANDGEEVQDELYDDAVKIIQNEGKASTSFLQRKLQIGYNRAARIIEMMETNGIVSKANHVGKREVLK